MHETLGWRSTLRGAGGLEAQDRGRHGDVERLGAAAVVDAHPVVDRRVGGEAVGLAAEDDGDAAAPVGGRVRRAAGATTSRSCGSPAARTSATVGRTTGTWNSAPADARTTFGFVQSTVPGVTTSASTPAASAERRIVPRLPGSASRSATTTNAARSRTSVATAGSRTTANRPGAVSVALIRSATPGASRVHRPGAVDRADAGRDELRPRRPSRRRPPRRRARRPRRRTHPRRNANCGARGGAAVAGSWCS